MIYLLVLDIELNGGIEKSTLNLKDNLVSFYGEDNVKIVSIRNDNKDSIFSNISFLKKLSKTFKSGDVVISMYDRISILLSIIFGIGFRNNKKPKLISFQHADYYAHSLSVRLLRILSYKFVDKIVTLTKKDASLYHNKKAVCTIPNSIPDITIETPHWSDRNIDFISVGRLVEVKQFNYVVDLIPIINDEVSYRFNIYGDGPERTNLEKKVVNLGLEVDEVLKGNIDNVFLPMKNSKVLLVTSQRESFSMVIIEAMLCGCIVISFDCETGPREIITDNHDGFLVRPNDLNAIKEIFDFLIRNADEAERISANAKLTAEKYKNSNVLKNWIEII
ncbi:glycosyltransferase [Vibrio sp. OCN044]|uniref:Glycosyltransferase n=1 Tax=Vibrio tetraodonis subsp. pristinus TaxID=2695891 RepID=A0A6L8M3Z9_9VIBR|nr:glycosyltransferase [Vibrio tetraodonis]MYM60719.1 glycosyltransferase [Vibrio tetraodonis subsp. pristinus]